MRVQNQAPKQLWGAWGRALTPLSPGPGVGGVHVLCLPSLARLLLPDFQMLAFSSVVSNL